MNFIIKFKKLFALLFWLWIALILTFTFIPNSPKMELQLKEDNLRLDYLLHFLVYFSLAILYLLWKANTYFKIKPNLIVYFLIGGLVLAIGSEFTQSLIPNRSFNPYDLISNVSGILFGVVAPKLLFK